MGGSFYMYLDSLDSLSTRPNNSWRDFTCDFIPEIVLEENCPFGLRLCNWSFALVEMSIADEKKDSLFSLTLPDSVAILCDLARDSHIKSVARPILRTISASLEVSATLGQTFYVDVIRHRFTSINIKILNRDLTPITLESGWPSDKAQTRCTLHFIRN